MYGRACSYMGGRAVAPSLAHSLDMGYFCFFVSFSVFAILLLFFFVLVFLFFSLFSFSCVCAARSVFFWLSFFRSFVLAF